MKKSVRPKHCGKKKGITIDGHCNKENYLQLAEAGADILIVGNAGLFGLDPDLDRACRKMEEEYRQCMLDKAV